jgi:hypothetical protein
MRFALQRFHFVPTGAVVSLFFTGGICPVLFCASGGGRPLSQDRPLSIVAAAYRDKSREWNVSTQNWNLSLNSRNSGLPVSAGRKGYQAVLFPTTHHQRGLACLGFAPADFVLSSSTVE